LLQLTLCSVRYPSFMTNRTTKSPQVPFTAWAVAVNERAAHTSTIRRNEAMRMAMAGICTVCFLLAAGLEFAFSASGFNPSWKNQKVEICEDCWLHRSSSAGFSTRFAGFFLRPGLSAPPGRGAAKAPPTVPLHRAGGCWHNSTDGLSNRFLI
jgi:hypothetical protein